MIRLDKCPLDIIPDINCPLCSATSPKLIQFKVYKKQAPYVCARSIDYVKNQGSLSEFIS